MRKLNNTLLDKKSKKEVTREIRRYPETNENNNTTY